METKLNGDPRLGPAADSSMGDDMPEHLRTAEAVASSSDARWSPRATIVLCLGLGAGLWALIAWGLSALR